MCDIKSMGSKNLYSVIGELIEENECVKITVTGMSMYPFLRDKKDSVGLSKTNFGQIKRGNIVMICRDNGEYIVHRVIRKKRDCFYIIGDAEQEIEGPLMKEQLVAAVKSVWRRGMRIETDNLLWIIISEFWLWFRPIRYFIFRNYRLFIRFIHN